MILYYEFKRLREGGTITDNNGETWTCTGVETRYANKAVHLRRQDGITARMWWSHDLGPQCDEPLNELLFGGRTYVTSFSSAA